jgi:hypothetical protein
MIIDNPNCVLFIEPKGRNLEKEIKDELTDFLNEKIEFVEREYTTYCLDDTRTFKPAVNWGLVNDDGSFSKNTTTRGVHYCVCHAKSANFDFELADGMYTNTLAVHYMLYHRSEVPAQEIEKVKLAMSKCANVKK